MTRKSTVTVALADLDLALAATIPFTGVDGEIPADVDVVHLSAGDGQLTVAATNGYVAGRVRKPATGQLDGTFYLDRTHAELLRTALAFHLDVLSTMPVTLTVDDQWTKRLLTVGVDLDFTFSFHDRAVVSPANLDRVFAAPTHGTPTAGDETPLFAERLEPFLRLGALAGGEPLRWTLLGPRRSSLVQLGDWFTGVLMASAPGEKAGTGR